jgi:Ni,Fe-hydrogenase III small subunit
MDVLNNLELGKSGVDDRFAYAHKIATDLFQYMSSFAQEPRQADWMVVPTNILDRWLERFERKYRLDPNFMLKPSI